MKVTRSALSQVIGCTLITSSFLLASPATAGMQNQMESMFSGMANVTDPSAFKTQTRGGMTFGGVSVRTPIIDQNIATWVPPSAGGGCGGIDMSGGSFSFIDGQQIVNTLQKVASNAEGYAFQLALDAVYPEAAAWIETFQKKMQSMNEFLGNSCQLAQGVVNDTKSAIFGQERSESQTTASISGAANGFYDSWSENWSSKDEQDSPETADEYKVDKGNYVYRALMETSAITAFQDGDQDMAEHIMSVTGTVIMPLQVELGAHESNPNLAGKTGKWVNVLSYNLPTMDLIDILYGPRNGRDLKVLRCGTSTNATTFCDTPTANTDSDFEGYDDLIKEALLGDAATGSVGLVNKLMNPIGTLTDEEKAVMVSLPSNQGKMIRDMALKAPGSAKTFAYRVAEGLALDMAYNTTIEAIDQAINGLNQIKTIGPEARDSLMTRREQITEEYNQMRANEIGNVDDAMQMYQHVMDMTTSKRYIELSSQR